MLTAVTGSLIIAEQPTSTFPAIPSDANLFVSGVVGSGPRSVFGGEVVISGSLSVRGGSITTSATTFNIVNATATTVNIGGAATTMNLGGGAGAVNTNNDLFVNGDAIVGTVVERMLTGSGGTGVTTFDMASQSVFHRKAPTGNITANFTNVPTVANRVITPTVILSQSGSPFLVNAVQINSSAETILWANGVTPTATANRFEVFGFSLIRSGSTWTVLGQMSSYG